MSKFLRVEQYIEKVVEQQFIPGAVLAIATADECLYKRAFGYAYPDKRIDMTTDTIFDAASLTKVMATLPALLVCLERGMLDLDDAVAYYFPEFSTHYGDVTIKHLATHTSGWEPFIQFYVHKTPLHLVMATIAAQPKRHAVGEQVIYSDLNFIVLGKIIEVVTNESLADFTATNIYKPLKMKSTQFNPPADLQARIAPTEPIAEGGCVWGHVHDENAHYFGGVSGHAGLFTTAGDALKFGQTFLRGGTPLLQTATVQLAAKNFTAQTNDRRGIGWDLYADGKFSGQYLMDGFGHTGFTGTSIWVSPTKDLVVVLLTNRVHFGRETNIGQFRRIVHNLIALSH